MVVTEVVSACDVDSTASGASVSATGSAVAHATARAIAATRGKTRCILRRPETCALGPCRRSTPINPPAPPGTRRAPRSSLDCLTTKGRVR
ncbi:MAG: hypothetical protein HKN24_08715 [Acidimicrobiales bacterium]|nr:hypothetical protein [Acidimicrobiales bacterium]